MTALSPNIFAKPDGGSARSARPRLTNAIMADRAAVAAAEIATLRQKLAAAEARIWEIEHKDNVVQIKNAALRYRPADAATAEQPKPTSSPSGQRPTAARERKPERTVYVLSYGRPKPVQIKTGISDGIMTEVTEGLKEGDKVVTAELTSPAASSSPPANPFSGGQRRFP